MSGTLVLLSFCYLSLACQGLPHDGGIELAQIRDELRRQGEITDALMKLVQDQHARIASQEERIQLLSEHVSEQDKIIESQAKRVADLENKNALLEEILSQRYNLSSSAEKFPSDKDIESDFSRTTNERMTAGMVRPRVNGRAVEGPVAFQAGVNKVDVAHIALHEKLIFDNVKLNLGGGYHGQFGLFIAPKAGIYIFSVTILANANTDIEVLIKKNGVDFGGAYGCTVGESGFDQGSVTVVLQLAIGDEVYVENAWPDNTSLRANGQSNFMGCLIMEL